jgi:hypothetical protein
MTREHLFFIPLIFTLGFVAGALATRSRDRDNPPSTRPSGRWVIVGAVALGVVFAATHVFSMHGGVRQLADVMGGQPIFDQRPSFTADEVYARLEAFGALGRAAYQRMTFSSDLVFPLALFHFLVQLNRFVVQIVANKPRGILHWAPWAPGLWLLADLTENALIWRLIEDFPLRHDSLAGMLGTMTDTKFALLVASLAVPAAALWSHARRSLATRRD